MLSNDIYALLNTVVLVLLPFTGWLAASIIALVTLRKGLKAGGLLLVPALIAHFIMLKTTLSISGATLGCFLSFVPCYLAAGVLRTTKSWRMVSCLLFLMTLLAMSMLQTFWSELITQQYLYLREMLNQLQLDNTLLMLSKTTNQAEQVVFANYLVGVQTAAIALSALLSLVFARFIQSRIFYPEGFKQEMFAIRAKKVDLILFFVTMFAVKQHYLLAIDVLPMLLLFFFIIGLSFWFDCMARQGMFVPMMVVSVVLGFFPYVLLPVYVMVGVLDTLVNFRLYLSHRAGKAIREVK